MVYSSEDGRGTVCNSMDAPRNSVKWKKSDAKGTTHLYKVQKQAKLVCAVQSQDGDCPWVESWLEENVTGAPGVPDMRAGYRSVWKFTFPSTSLITSTKSSKKFVLDLTVLKTVSSASPHLWEFCASHLSPTSLLPFPRLWHACLPHLPGKTQCRGI